MSVFNLDTNSSKKWYHSKEWEDASSIHLSSLTSKFQTCVLELSDANFIQFHVGSFEIKSENLNLDYLYTPEFNFHYKILENRDLTSEFKIQEHFHIRPVKDVHEIIKLFASHYKFNFYILCSNWFSNNTTSVEYWSKRPSILLNTIRRKRLKCNKALCHIEIFTNISSELKKHYWQVYNRSWKPAEASPEFINWLLDYTSEQGLLRLGFTYIDSRPIAMHFWIVQDGTASIFKLAQDKEFDHLSPGTVLMAEMIDWVYAHDEIHCIDFLTGSDDYKKLWMDECRPLYGLEIFNMKTIRGRLLWYRHCIIRFLKSIRSRFNKHE